MTYEVVIQLTANGQRRQLAREDPEGMRAVRAAIGDLEKETRSRRTRSRREPSASAG